ncbi:uncharacterized protein [Amphiura filiformis]|uniref:uncharacterized protein n=1 Tax=Amphiura filiformis TaxID=82378 RepID=UPI003B225266
MSISDQPLLKSPGVQTLSFVSTANMFERGPSSPGSISRLTFMGRETGIDKTIAALGVLSILSLLQSILAVILIVRLDFKQDEFQNFSKSVTKLDEERYDSMLDSAMVLASFCVMLNFCCMVVCTIQCYFAAKMMKLPQGEERAYKFLSNTSGARFVVISAFFAAIPVFLSALCLYLLIEFRLVPAIVSSSFIALGVIFTIVCFSRSAHLWRKEQKRVAKGLNAYEPSTPSPSQTDHHSGPLTMVNNNNGGFINGGLPNGGLANGGLANGGLANGSAKNGWTGNGLIVGSANGDLHKHDKYHNQDDSVDGSDEKMVDKTPMFYALGSGDTLNTSNLSTLV